MKRRPAGCDQNAKWRSRDSFITFRADINERRTSHQGFVMSCVNHLAQDAVLILKYVSSKTAPLWKTVIFNKLKDRQLGNGFICNLDNVAGSLLVWPCNTSSIFSTESQRASNSPLEVYWLTREFSDKYLSLNWFSYFFPHFILVSVTRAHASLDDVWILSIQLCNRKYNFWRFNMLGVKWTAVRL